MLALIALLLAIVAIMPTATHWWPIVVFGAPAWMMTFFQALSLIAALILGAGSVAVAVSLLRERRNG